MAEAMPFKAQFCANFNTQSSANRFSWIAMFGRPVTKPTFVADRL
jgi:hypothetical protein